MWYNNIAFSFFRINFQLFDFPILIIHFYSCIVGRV